MHFPAPPTPQTLFALVGEQESEEYLRQNQRIRDAWGPARCRYARRCRAANHFTVMHDLADPQGRSHQLARKLLGLRLYSGLL